MQLNDVFALQKIIVAEIKVREITLVKQVKKVEKVVDKIKVNMQKTE